LLERLTPQQVDMVVMHELAHVIGRHFLWRVFPMLWAVGVVVLFGFFWPATEELKLVGTLSSSIVACVVMLMGMSAMAHHCELAADSSACLLAEKACDWARENPSQAHLELAAALIQLLRDCPQAASASWLHPSLLQRLKNLNWTSDSAFQIGTAGQRLESQ
jgi:Zn-dependent protease with chaperone function